jgi:hypothetical protein
MSALSGAFPRARFDPLEESGCGFAMHASRIIHTKNPSARVQHRTSFQYGVSDKAKAFL